MQDSVASEKHVIQIQIDTGTAYGKPEPTYKLELAQVGKGTPMGELMRRYWHQIGRAHV